MNSLKNKVIISKPSMIDYFFEKSIIYITEHNKDGATGFVLNKKVSKPISKKLLSSEFLEKKQS